MLDESHKRETDHSCPWQWAGTEDVIELLSKILCNPLDDHRSSVSYRLKQPLLLGEVASMCRALKKGPSLMFPGSFTNDVAIALHCILFHLLGEAAGLVPLPPGPIQRDFALTCRPLQKAGDTLQSKFFCLLAKANVQAKRGDVQLLRELQQKPFHFDKFMSRKTDPPAVNSECRPPPAPLPPPTELEKLRRLTWQLELELRSERARADGLKLQLDDMTTRRLQAEVKAATLEASCEITLNRRQRQQESCMNNYHTKVKELQTQLAELRSNNGRLQRSHQKDINDINAEWHHKLQQQERAAIDRLREQDAEIRPLNAELKQLREAAVAHAAELAGRVAELETGLKRLHCSSKGDLQQLVDALREQVQQLSTRRKVNQLKIKDVNLARRAASASTESARKQACVWVGVRAWSVLIHV